MQPSSSRPPHVQGTDPSCDDAIAVVHSSLKEVEWIRKLSNRLCRSGHPLGGHERDLECILELSGSVARAMRSFLDEARRTDPDAAPRAEIGALVEQAVLQVSRRGAVPPLQVDIDEQARSAAVVGQLLVALVAIIENAVDFSSGEAPVRVRVRCQLDALEICIEDRGVGMDEHVVAVCRARGFTTRGHGGGHGFGLCSAARIVSQSGGELRVESTPGEGTRVFLTVPYVALPQCTPAFDRAPPATAPTAARASGPARRRQPRGSRY